MTAQAAAPTRDPEVHTVKETFTTTCCVVGGGPAGAVLSLLLARQGINVTLLEAHKDFDRDFRGDTLHPSTMEIMDQLGLVDRLLELPHNKLSVMTVNAPSGPFEVANLSHLKTRFNYITMMPQVEFLDFITSEAAKYPGFHLIMNANVNELIEEDGVVRGVRYVAPDGRYEVRALLTVGADGRFSRVRKLSRFEAVSTSPPMDIVWFRVPRFPDDPSGGMGRFNRGHISIQLERGSDWQVGYVIPKGGYRDLKEAGLDALKREIAEMNPAFAVRVNALNDWHDFSLLSVEADRVKRWYRPGLLLIGDAAHVMSPVGGNGINYAIQDAVEAANILAKPLKTGHVEISHLAKVQRRREWPTRIVQRIVTGLQRNLIASALDPNKPPLDIPFFMRWPILRDIPARFVGFGIGRVRVKELK